MSNQMSQEIRQLFYNESHRGTNWSGSHREDLPKKVETREERERRIADLMKRAHRKK